MRFILIGYIDPGSGAMLLQWIIAAVLGGGIMFRRAIAHFFAMIFGKNKNPDTEEKQEAEKKEDE